MLETCLLTPSKEGMRDQIMDATKVQVVEAIVFIVATYRSMNKELLTGAENTHRHLHHQNPPQHE